jgi:alkaline phosphatase
MKGIKVVYLAVEQLKSMIVFVLFGGGVKLEENKKQVSKKEDMKENKKEFNWESTYLLVSEIKTRKKYIR